MGRNGPKTSSMFWGSFDVCVLSDGRLRLPNAMAAQLEAAGVDGLWLGILPKQPALLLCPQSRWPVHRQRIRKAYPDLSPAEVDRLYLALCQPITIDSEGRISPPAKLRQYADIHPEDDVTILGVEDHLELWNAETLKEWASCAEGRSNNV